MRLLLLTHRLPYAPNRGDRIRAYHLLRTLAAQHEVHLLSLVHDAEESAAVDAVRGVAASVIPIAISRRARLAAAALALPSDRPLTHVLLHDRAVAPALRTLVAAVQPELVVAYCTAMARYALEPPLSQLPCLLDMVDVDSEKWLTMARGRGPLARVYGREARLLRSFEHRAMDHACATTVVSERERILLSTIAPEHRAVVVPNGIDLGAFRPPAAPSASPAVIFCGVFNYGPNEAGAGWLATEVWPLVTREMPEATLWLVGMHPTAAVQRLARDRSVHVTGAVPEVQPYLWRSAVAAAPLQLARGVQNKVLEALAAGLPCVVTPPVMEGLPVTVRAGCDAAASPREFADALLARLRQTPAARRHRAAAADLSALGWDVQLAPMLGLIRSAA